MKPGYKRLPRGSLPLLALAASLPLAVPAAAGSLSVLHSFTGGNDGATPYKGLLRDSAGNLYGETFYGANACPDSYLYANVGCGTVYRIAASGVEKTLAIFHGAPNGADGFSNLTLNNSLLYGGAFLGGGHNQGVIFSETTAGASFTVLHTFKGLDGSHPNSYLRLSPDGGMYSVAQAGGPGFNGTVGSGSGVLFKVTTDGTYTPEHYFSGGADGASPGRIFLDASGTIFGTAATGGRCTASGAPAAGCGVAYSFVPSTGVFTVLYTFQDTNDGYAPQLGAVDANDDLFGSTPSGGSNNQGTLFELVNKNGVYAYHSEWAFTGGADGGQPLAPPSMTGGTLVGTTEFGGSGNAGTLFTFRGGTLTTLYNFSNDANGGYPQGTPIMAANGTIYGVTAFGGIQPCNTAANSLISSYGCGVVFEYTP